jgi:hypothetical protein
MCAQVGIVDKVLSNLDLKIISYNPINWRKVQTTPVYMLRAQEGEFFLKFISSSETMRQNIIRMLFGSLAIKNQLAVYDSLSRLEFKNFKYPQLVNTDKKSYLIFDFIQIQSKGERDAPRDALVESLLEFQRSGVFLKRRGIEGVLLNITRKPACVLLKRVLVGLRKQCGIKISFRCIKVILDCYKHQKPLENILTLHNDFHHNNLLLTKSGELFVCDFENVANERRWALIDITHYSVGTMRFEIDTSLIGMYIKNENSIFKLMNRFQIGVQLRIALLLRVSQMILSNKPPIHVKDKYLKFFVDTLLEDSAYESWFESSEIL